MDIDEVREKIVKLLNELRWELSKPNAVITIDTLAISQRAYADQILSTPLSEGKKCPDCVGTKSAWSNKLQKIAPCLKCKGSGVLPPVTIETVIKEKLE